MIQVKEVIIFTVKRALSNKKNKAKNINKQFTK